MIQIICKSESYTYNAYHILKAFYPSQEVSCKTDEEASNYVTVQLPDGQEIFAETENLQTEKKRQTDLNLYDQLEKITGEPLAWGSRLEKRRLYQMGMGKRKSKKRKGSACMGDCREGAEDSGRTGL